MILLVWMDGGEERKEVGSCRTMPCVRGLGSREYSDYLEVVMGAAKATRSRWVCDKAKGNDSKKLGWRQIQTKLVYSWNLPETGVGCVCVCLHPSLPGVSSSWFEVKVERDAVCSPVSSGISQSGSFCRTCPTQTM